MWCCCYGYVVPWLLLLRQGVRVVVVLLRSWRLRCWPVMVARSCYGRRCGVFRRLRCAQRGQTPEVNCLGSKPRSATHYPGHGP